MKTLIIILLGVITFNCNAQLINTTSTLSKESPEMLIPISIVAVTFVTTDLMIRSNQSAINTSTIAITGIATSIMSYKVIQALKTNSPKRIRKRRIKRLITL